MHFYYNSWLGLYVLLQLCVPTPCYSASVTRLHSPPTQWLYLWKSVVIRDIWNMMAANQNPRGRLDMNCLCCSVNSHEIPATILLRARHPERPPAPLHSHISGLDRTPLGIFFGLSSTCMKTLVPCVWRRLLCLTFVCVTLSPKSLKSFYSPTVLRTFWHFLVFY